MTGAKQNYARKHIIAIDIIDFDFIVISNEEKTDLTKSPEDGVYVHGLFVEGCRWDERKEALEESQPKISFFGGLFGGFGKSGGKVENK